MNFAKPVSNQKVWSIKIKGLTGILYSNEEAMVTTPPKDRKMDWVEYGQMYWLEKAHLNSDGICIIPDMWIKKAAIRSQKSTAVPIKTKTGGSKSNMKEYITACLFGDKSLIYKDEKLTIPYMKDDLKQFSKGVNRGTMSAPKKVMCIRPIVETPWVSDLKITDLEGVLTDEQLYTIYYWVGRRNGFGDWRIERGGSYGAFDVLAIEQIS
jgi:hypothetical protein